MEVQGKVLPALDRLEARLPEDGTTPRTERLRELSRLLLDLPEVRGVAVLGFPPGEARLGLLAAGPSEVSPLLGGTARWEIPVRSLRNRRITVIEEADRNPFVPQNFRQLSPEGLTIACLPVYDTLRPLGAVVLFGGHAHAFPDSFLAELGRRLACHARSLFLDKEEESPAEIPAAASRSSPPRPVRPVADSPEREDGTSRTILSNRVRELEETVRSLRERTASLEDRVLAAESDRARARRIADALRTELERARAELANERDTREHELRDLRERLASAEAEKRALGERGDALLRELERLEAEVRRAEKELAEARTSHAEKVAELLAERERWRTRAEAVERDYREQTERLRVLERNHRAATAARTTVSNQLRALKVQLEEALERENRLREELAVSEHARRAAESQSRNFRDELEHEKARCRTLRSELDGAAQLRARLEMLEAQLAERERQLRSAEETARELREAYELAERERCSSEEERRRLEDLCARLRQENARLELERDEIRDHLGRLVEERSSGEEELRGAVEESRLRAEAAEKERDAVLRELETFRARLRESEKALEDHRRSSERSAREWHEQQARLRSTIDSLSLEAARARERTEVVEAALRAAETEREQLRAELESRRTAEEKLREELATALRALEETERIRREGTSEEVESLRERISELEALLAVARTQAEQEREREITAQEKARRAREDLDAVQRELLETREILGEVRRRLELRERQISELQDASVRQQAESRAREEAQRAVVPRLEARVATLEQELSRVRQEKDREVEAARALAAAERAESEAKDAEIEKLRARIEDLESRLASAEKAKPDLPVPAPYRTLEIERSGGARNDTVPAPEPPGEATEPVFLVDTPPLREEARAALQARGFSVTGIDLEGATDELARRKARLVLFNLASGAAAWNELRNLRERVATRDIPLLVYAMLPDSPCGFSFAGSDFLPWPFPPSRIVERVRKLRPDTRQLLLASPDLDAVTPLREALSKARFSTSVVLEARQAREIVAGLRPHAAILHLVPHSPEALRILLALRFAGGDRELPTLLLLDHARPESSVARFVEELVRHGTLDWHTLATEVERACVSLPAECGESRGPGQEGR
ncbi:MAG: hypothetical protein KatS3mg076_1281 [Candidatus Binatia bacterium]|nr:MAG: hypothetical protein KatS3mg076_1281 [Candidatus Binatia bacterium]